jgi:hypothetical protein
LPIPTRRADTAHVSDASSCVRAFFPFCLEMGGGSARLC